MLKLTNLVTDEEESPQLYSTFKPKFWVSDQKIIGAAKNLPFVPFQEAPNRICGNLLDISQKKVSTVPTLAPQSLSFTLFFFRY